MILFNKVMTATFKSTKHKDIPEMVIGDKESVTMAAGLRPSLSLSLDMIPGMYCFNGSLQVVNLPSSTDILVYDHVTIRAGYTPNMKEIDNIVTLEGDVFSSYTLSPPPDSVTVFNFILMTTEYGLMIQDKNFVINWGKYATKYDALLDIFASLKLSWSADKDTMDTLKKAKPFSSNRTNNSFSSVNALLTFLNKDLEEIGCACFYSSGDKLVYVYTTSPSTVPGTENDVITLQGVSSINFNAAMLTVQSPWVPRLVPGKYIKLSSMFYNGEQLPNIAKADGSFKGKNDLYEVLTLRVNFSNTAATNNMVITAVPVKESVKPITLDTKQITIGYDHKIEGTPLLNIPEDVASSTRNYGLYEKYVTFPIARPLQAILTELTESNKYNLPSYIIPISAGVAERIKEEITNGVSILKDIKWRDLQDLSVYIQGSVLAYIPSFILNSPSKDSTTPTTPVYFNHVTGCFSINNQQQRNIGHYVRLPQPYRGTTTGALHDWMEKYTVPYLSVYEEILFGDTLLFKDDQDSILKVYTLYRLSGGVRLKTSYTNPW